MKRSSATHINVVLFSAFSFLADVGFVCGIFPMNAMLVQRAGPGALFSAYVWSSIAVLLLTGAFFQVADRLSRRMSLCVTHLVFGGAVLWAWHILQHPAVPVWVYPALLSLFYASYVLLTLQLWLLASEHFGAYEARRYAPYIVAASVGGIIIGGALTAFAAAHTAAVNVLLGWVAILWSSPWLVFWARQSPYAPVVRTNKAVVPTPLRVTPLVVALFGFWLLYSLLCHGIDYRFNVIALHILQNENALTAYFGQVASYAGAATFVYALCIARPLLTWGGIERTMLLIPLLAVLSCGLLIAQPTLITMGIAEGALYFFAEFAAIALLQPVLNVVPRPLRGRVKIVTEGFGRAAGTLVLFLCAYLLLLSVGLARLDLMLWGLAIIFCVYPFLFHRIYVRHLVRCLQSSDPELMTNAIQALGEPNKNRAVPSLLSLLHASKTIALKRTIVLSLGHMRSGEAFHDVVQLFSVRDESLQSAVVTALADYRDYRSVLAIFRLMKSGQNVSLQVRMNAIMVLTRLVGRAMIPFLLEALDDPDVRVQANTIEALGVLRDRKMIALLLPYLSHEHHRVRSSAIIALYPFRWRSDGARAQALRALAALYHSTALVEQLTALYVIGVLQLRSYIPVLIALLESTDRHMRQLAAVALARLHRPHGVPVLMALLQADDEKFAIDTGKRLGTFPATSRWWIFEGIANLIEVRRALVLQRLDATGLDFTLEKDLLSRHATSFTYVRL